MNSIDAFDIITNGELMFKYLDNMVEEIGEENVVQVITNNASNYVNPGTRLMEKRIRLWTPCPAHCIDMMLEDVGELNVHTNTLLQAKQVVKFIYGHTWILSLLGTFTKNHLLICPTTTQFVITFLTSKVFISKNKFL